MIKKIDFGVPGYLIVVLLFRPSYSSSRYNLGVTCLRIEDKRSALKEYEKLKTYDEGAASALKKEIDHAT